MADQTVLVVGHGSRVPQAVAQFHEFADALAVHLGQPVERCFMELVAPDLAAGLANAARQAAAGTRQVVVLPLFLAAAGHQRNDVAAAVQWARGTFPSINFHYAAPLGPHPRLVDLLDQRIREALAADTVEWPLSRTSVLVVGRGSSDPGANSELARVAYLLADGRGYLSVEYAFQAAARPTVEEGVRRCQQFGASRVVVAPYVLFTGRVADAICASAQRVGDASGPRIVCAGHLGTEPLSIQVAAQRFHEAVLGMAAVNCDLCKYRFAMAGHESEVGLPQVSDHFHPVGM